MALAAIGCARAELGFAAVRPVVVAIGPAVVAIFFACVDACAAILVVFEAGGALRVECVCFGVEFGAREAAGEAGFGGVDIDAVRGVGRAAVFVGFKFVVTLVLAGARFDIVTRDGSVLFCEIGGHFLADDGPIGSCFGFAASAVEAVGVVVAAVVASTAIFVVCLEVDGAFGGILVAFGESGIVIAEAAKSFDANQAIEAFVAAGHTVIGVAVADIGDDVAGGGIAADAEAVTWVGFSTLESCSLTK